MVARLLKLAALPKHRGFAAPSTLDEFAFVRSRDLGESEPEQAQAQADTTVICARLDVLEKDLVLFRDDAANFRHGLCEIESDMGLVQSQATDVRAVDNIVVAEPSLQSVDEVRFSVFDLGGVVILKRYEDKEGKEELNVRRSGVFVQVRDLRKFHMASLEEPLLASLQLYCNEGGARKKLLEHDLIRDGVLVRGASSFKIMAGVIAMV